MKYLLRGVAVGLLSVAALALPAQAAVPATLQQQVPAPSPACVDATNPNPADPRWFALSQEVQGGGDLLNVGVVGGQVVQYRVSQLHAISAGPTHQVILPDNDHLWIWLCP